jgi:hypothetical protein
MTTRDWLWFCVVLFLALGWGAHFRYTQYKDNPVPYKSPPNADELQRSLSRMKDHAAEEATKNRALSTALREMRETSLTISQRQEIDLKVKEFLTAEPSLTTAQKDRIYDQLHIVLFTIDEIKQMEPDWYDKRIDRLLNANDQ